ESLESLHEAGLAMVLRSDLADQGFPFLLASGFLEELPGSLEVPESSVVVLALLRVEDTEAQGSIELGRGIRMRLLQLFGGGLGRVMAEIFESPWFASTNKICQPVPLLCLDVEFDGIA